MKNIGNFYLKIFSCLEVKLSIYLNRRVFVMRWRFEWKLVLRLMVVICMVQILITVTDLEPQNCVTVMGCSRNLELNSVENYHWGSKLVLYSYPPFSSYQSSSYRSSTNRLIKQFGLTTVTMVPNHFICAWPTDSSTELADNQQKRNHR